MERIIAGKFDEYDFPYLEVEVLNKAKGLSQPAKAIIDTGAAHCMIREELALQLQLEVPSRSGLPPPGIRQVSA